MIILARLAWPAEGERPWQRIVMPTSREAAEQFRDPPPEYGLTLWWWWNGAMTQDEIVRDLRDIKAHGVNSVLLWAYYGLSLQYLSPEWFDRVRYAVEQARRLNMRVWLMDEGSYPSGFAGGRISKEHPELRMQVLTSGQPVPVAPGGRVSLHLPEDLVAAIAVNRLTGAAVALDASPGTILEWSAPPGEWVILVVRHECRTSPTRFVHTPGFRKDTTYSFIDPLNPAATRQFVAYVHDEYKKHIGHEFGKTVLGFMGDEPSVAGIPWTPGIVKEFERRKGYDLRTRLAALVHPELARDSRLVRADYWDVWTDLYSDHFFKVQTDWCAREGLDYIVHLCGEEDMKTLLQLNGDYFKCNRTVQVPGVDAIWRQIWPGKVADYPKLASSAAHLRGHPRSFTESYGVYGAGLSIEQAKWVLDHQFVRGINQFQAMGYSSSNAEFRRTFGPPNWNGDPQWAYFPPLAAYANRVSYLLSVGRPAASIAVYYPTTSGWLGDFAADRAALSIARELLERQRDFDFIDEDGLQSPAAVRDGAIWNSSGQAYRAVMIPSVAVISKNALATLEQFARGGGHVIFLGRLPSLVNGRSFLFAEPASANPLVKDSAAPALPSIGIEPSVSLTAKVLAQLPPADLELAPSQPDVKYLHRSLADSEVFFLFNESGKQVETEARFRSAGTPELWDALDGSRHRLRFRRSGAVVSVPLRFEPGATTLVVFTASPTPDGPEANRYPELLPVLALDGDWGVTMADASFRSDLKPWAEFGKPAFCGSGNYRKEFRLPSSAAGRGRLFLDLGEVRYTARVRLNGHDLGARSWAPFRWDITRFVRPGDNALEIDVSNTGANRLAADPVYYQETESRGWLRNSYVGMYLKFDKEMIPSGLIGPVRILRASEQT